jgi:hypothetical protein
MGDFGSSTELTEINPALLKNESMGALDCVKNFISNNSVPLLMAGILILGIMAMSDDKKAKR